MPRRNVTEAPSWLEIEPKLATAATPANELRLELRVVTPILGGGVKARTLDEVDVIRAPSIRGQLRFWWRALYGHGYETPEALYDAESKIWGGVAKDARKSAIAVRVTDVRKGEKDPSDIQPFKKGPVPKTTGAYALFPARALPGEVAAARWKPGTSFTLVVRIAARLQGDATVAAQVKRTLAAWVLFGGIGSRTRRGLGALEPLRDTAAALDLERFVSDELGPSASGKERRSFAQFAGARIHVDVASNRDAMHAWETALDWLNDFRQKAGVARDAAHPPRPGRSRWPEPDIVRRLNGADRNPQRFAHEVRYKGPLAYPRAQFGLPIIAQWQKRDRNNQQYAAGEPPAFELKLDGHDRLASALIVKPLWTPQEWKACALWLERTPPPTQVGVAQNGQLLPNSLAPFDRMPDECSFEPLRGKATVRDGFFDWLASRNGT